MSYMLPATTLTPALVIFLIDTSDSMNDICGSEKKIEIVNASMREAVRHMVRRSMRDGQPQPQYQVAIVSYNTRVVDELQGIRSLPELVTNGVPVLEAKGETDTTAGFAKVEELLKEHMTKLEKSALPPGPAPLICHLTDANFTTDDPGPIIKRIRAMQVQDGAVLVENMYVAQDMLQTPVEDWLQWKGVMREGDLRNEHAKRLFRLSSTLPEVYRLNINNAGYHLQKGAFLFFPGVHRELFKLAFAVTAGSQLK